MASPPPNPYAPGHAVADEGAAEIKMPSRSVVFLVSFLAGTVLPGLGLVLLGRPRRFLKWCAAGLGTLTVCLIAGLAAWPKLFAASAIVAIAIRIGALVDSSHAKPLPPPAKPALPTWLAVTIAIVVGFGGQALMRARLLEAFQVPGASMMPTLLAGDHFFVDKLHRLPQRGDVVIFELPKDPEITYVKRVIAVGGDRIEMKEGVLWLNGKELPQKELGQPCPEVEYAAACSWREESVDGRSYGIFRAVGLAPYAPPFEVPPGHVYVVGDDRDNSNDSRAWGTVPLGNVKGKALFVWWSRSPEGEYRWHRLGQVVR
jgi:signal peptidase I